MKKIYLVLKVIIWIFIIPILLITLVGCTYNYGEVYTLQEAYEKELLTYDDLLNIAYLNNGGNYYNEDLYPNDFEPILIDNLSENQIHKIKSTMSKTNEEYNSYSIKAYYGTYNGAIVFKISSFLYNIPTVETKENVGGLNFIYPSYNIKVFFEN